MRNVIIRSEKESEISIGTNILRLAFDNDTNAKMVAALRRSSDFVPDLSIVADEEGELVGYALYCHTLVGAQPCAFLATIAVLPAKQKQGVGERLVRHGLERCRGLGLELVFVAGKPEYFSRLGFKPAHARGITAALPQSDQILQVLDMSGRLLAKVSGTLDLPAALRG